MRKMITLLNWLIKRLVFIKRIAIEFFEKLIYQKDSQFLLESWNGHRTPFKVMIFYNFFGRLLWAGREFIALLLNNKLFKKTLLLEGYEEIPKYNLGDDDILWPRSPLHIDTAYKIDKEFCKKIENSLRIATEIEIKNFDKTDEWNRIAAVVKREFFDKDGHIIENKLKNFRADPDLYDELFNDQFSYLNQNESYEKSYLKSIDLILEYHRNGTKIDKSLLSSIGESQAGNNLCTYYQGRRVSKKSIFHTLIINDLIKIIKFQKEKRDLILDIGCGYGGLNRILYYYAPNSCQILLDLPETVVLTSYFIKYNFPDAKIALLDDIVDRLDNFNNLIYEYDFIIIPPSVLNNIENGSVDLVINTISMAFMQREYLQFYLDAIDRVLKNGGYFYSLNKVYNDKWGIGMYEWDFKNQYITKLFDYNNKFSFPQWLGQKIG